MIETDTVSTVLARFKSETGETVSNMMDLPRNVTVKNLQLICNTILKQVTDQICIIIIRFIILFEKTLDIKRKISFFFRMNQCHMRFLSMIKKSQKIWTNVWTEKNSALN